MVWTVRISQCTVEELFNFTSSLTRNCSICHSSLSWEYQFEVLACSGQFTVEFQEFTVRSGQLFTAPIYWALAGQSLPLTSSKIHQKFRKISWKLQCVFNKASICFRQSFNIASAGHMTQHNSCVFIWLQEINYRPSLCFSLLLSIVTNHRINQHNSLCWITITT